MAFDLIAKREGAGTCGFPNGFWPAFCIETPAAEVLGCEYTNRGTIKYDHDGFVGDWISEEEALRIHTLLLEYIKTDEYKVHRYFADRHNQMKQVIEFLSICGGFKKCD